MAYILASFKRLLSGLELEVCLSVQSPSPTSHPASHCMEEPPSGPTVEPRSALSED